MPKRRTKARRKPRKSYKSKKMTTRRVIDVGETKLQKQVYDMITHGVLYRNENATLMSPYTLDQNPAGQILFPTTWNNILPNTQALNKNFVSQGPAYNQRIGRRISPQSATIEIQCGFTAVEAAATRLYPFYANLRVIHGWCKEGVSGLPETLTDVPNLYSEIPYSKYKVLSDRVYIRKVNPAITLESASASDSRIGVYAPISFKKTWYPKGQKITFTDSLSDVTYAGWTPFLLILNPQHGSSTNSLRLEFRYIKRTFAFKDA